MIETSEQSETGDKPRTLFLAILGMGTVGRGLVEILSEKESWLIEKKRLAVYFTGIATKRNGIFNASTRAEALSPREVLARLKTNKAKNKGFDNNNPLEATDTLATFLKNPLHDIVIEVTPTVLAKSPTSAFLHIEQALKHSKHVVTANKGPIAEHYPYLKGLAKTHKRQLMIESTVMSGTPVFNLHKNTLCGNTLSGLEGILNGTSNFILNEMEEHRVSYTEALKKAQDLGYAESDPSYDVSGKDAMLKTVILANTLFETTLKLGDVTYEGIERLTLADIEQARKEKKCYKLISHIRSNSVSNTITANVELKKLSLTHPLTAITGALNAISLQTDLLGPITIIGAGAGKLSAAYGLFHDIMTLRKYCSHD